MSNVVCLKCGIELENFKGGAHGIVKLHRYLLYPGQPKGCNTPIPKPPKENNWKY